MATSDSERHVIDTTDSERQELYRIWDIDNKLYNGISPTFQDMGVMLESTP